ncbi:MAG: hypothetical protein QXW19_00785 [Candidatus Bathyarchaeia archaeon]
MAEEYKRAYAFGMDYGTSDFKFGPISCGEVPQIIENRGYFPDSGSIMYRAFERAREVIVGEEVPLYLQSSEDLALRLIYPMKNGVIAKDDERAWAVVREISRYGLSSFKPPEPEFRGFYVVASLSSIAPKYMYEKLFKIYGELAQEGLVAASTVIAQPFAVAIAHKITTCVVIESGHGNTQICPISRYPIRNAVVTINRGGGDANALTAEIMKDAGYGDLAREESLVRKVKEGIGLVPADLDKAIEEGKRNPKRLKVKFKVPGTRITIELEDEPWRRFLIGEFVFDPNHEIFQSYFRRGMPRPRDVKIGDATFLGMLDFGEGIARSVERCPVELQPHLYRQILLSGGNFSWQAPKELEGLAIDSKAKIKALLRRRGITNVKVIVADSPQYSVWRGCIIYGYVVPEDYEWDWDRMEGWMKP